MAISTTNTIAPMVPPIIAAVLVSSLAVSLFEVPSSKTLLQKATDLYLHTFSAKL